MEEGQSACEMTASYLLRQVGIADLDYRAVAGEAVQEVTSALRVEPSSFLLCDGLHQQVGHTSLYRNHTSHVTGRTWNSLLRMAADSRSPAIVKRDERAAMSTDCTGDIRG